MSRARVVIGLEPEDFCFELWGGARGYGVGARGYGVRARGYGSHEIILASPETGGTVYILSNFSFPFPFHSRLTF